MKLTSHQFWQSYWSGSCKSGQFHLKKEEYDALTDILQKYLPKAGKNKAIHFIEIGCYPGRYLYYFAKLFSYHVDGVDYLPEAISIKSKLAKVGIKSQIFISDIFALKLPLLYDVVFSMGFVEHFCNWQDLLEKHLSLLKPGGTLVIGFPNFRYGQYIIRYLIDRNFSMGHCLEIMDPHKWSQALVERGLIIKYCDYFQSFKIWIGPNSPAQKGKSKWRRAIFLCAFTIQRAVQKLKINIPNKIFSPQILIIAKKP